MSEFKIEKGIPIPPAATSGRWKNMEVGDSVFLVGKSLAQINTSQYAKSGILLAKRSVVENGVKGVRVWRIAEQASK